jgi:glycyl-radical enzyme activating protein
VEKQVVKGRVLRIQRYCINDGPGIRTTVFMKGCSLRCKWCHNPESQHPGTVLMLNQNLCRRCGLCVEQCSNHMHSIVNGVHNVKFLDCTACGDCLEVCMAEALSLHGQEMIVEEVMNEIVNDKDYYLASGGGLTISGGEPLNQPGFVIALSKASRDMGIPVYLDTCGSTDRETFEAVMNEVDGFLFDVKLIDPDLHANWTGQSNELILENFRLAVSSGLDVRMRVILIPGLTDTEANLEGLVRLAGSVGFKGPVDLMPYHSMASGKSANMGLKYEMEGFQTPSKEEIEKVMDFFESRDITVTIQ